MMKVFFYFLIPFLLLGCGTAATDLRPQGLQSIPEDAFLLREGWRTCGQYRVALDNRARLTDGQRNLIQTTGREAMAEWNGHLGFDLFVEVADNMCVPKDANIRLGDPGAGLATTLYGLSLFSSWCGCSITVSEVAAGSVKVIEHELGHCVGLTDSTNPESLMFKRAYGGEFSQEMISVVANNSEPDLFGRQEVFIPDCEGK